jgi:hypothetical protein
MSLDAELWAELQAHGVREAHLLMLLRLLQIQRNGWWGWHYVHGMVEQCDARLVFPSREVEVERVSEALCGAPVR